jgi:undecaprenyl pyrophosphate synthase
MPLFDEWNPEKGGALWKGSNWIIDTLGERPGREWSRDVVDHVKGFVPGNLRWAQKHTQNQNKQHRKLGEFTVEQLRVECRRHGFKLVKLPVHTPPVLLKIAA